MGFLVIAVILLIALGLSVYRDIGPQVRVHPLKPRKLPFFWEDFDIDEPVATSFIPREELRDEVRRKELARVVDISSRRSA